MAPSASPRTAARLRFDFPGRSDLPVSRVFEHPVAVVIAWQPSEVRQAFEDVEAAVRLGRYAAGFVSYEAASAFDPALVTHPPEPGLPLVWFGLFDRMDAVVPTPDRPPRSAVMPPTWQADTAPARFTGAIAGIREAIAAGDTYQVNYTFRLNSAIDPGGLTALYEDLRLAQRPPYAAHLDVGDWQILSLSPELFFHLQDGRLVGRPMKGTTLRGCFDADDHAAAERLSTSGKDRAENVMIVDLVRNDFGRVAEHGSVSAGPLFEVERYESVWQMVSTISAVPRPGTSIFDIFAAAFPAGSITGAPKTSAMRLIRDLETTPRGVYTGTIGFITPDGEAVFNVAIRTATVASSTGQATAGVGGGITWESLAEAEWAEAMSKASFLTATPAFSLFETMRLEGDRVVRLERHLDRLRTSAAFLDFPWNEDHVRAVLHAAIRPGQTDGRRVRLTLTERGDATVDLGDLPKDDAGPRTVALARTAVSSRNKFLYHKTTNRMVYDRARAARPDVFDILLWNERGELTEFTIGNVVVAIAGQRFTPPRSSGLLAGVFRAELLEEGLVAERVVNVGDLANVESLWLVNSLREWVDVQLIP